MVGGKGLATIGLLACSGGGSQDPMDGRG